MSSTTKQPRTGDVFVSGRSVWVVVRELPPAPYQAASGAVRALVREVTRWGVPVRGRARRDVRLYWPRSSARVLEPDAGLAALVRDALAMEPRRDPEREERANAALLDRLAAFERRHRARGRPPFRVEFSLACPCQDPRERYWARSVTVPCASLDAAKAAGDEALRGGLAQLVYLACLGGERRVLRRTRRTEWALDRKRTEAMA